MAGACLPKGNQAEPPENTVWRTATSRSRTRRAGRNTQLGSDEYQTDAAPSLAQELDLALVTSVDTPIDAA